MQMRLQCIVKALTERRN